MKFYNKAQSSDTPILLTILVFQAFIIVGLGFLELTSESQTIGAFSFSTNIINNIALLGWGNSILFAPLIICVIYIVAKLIRGGG
jgi:hypothetical protein